MYFVVMLRVNLIVILMTYVHYLYSINCPTIICLPSDVGMPFGYPRISIPSLAHYGSRQVQGLEDDLEMKKEGSNLYSTRTLINLSLVAYIKPGKGALEREHNIIDIEYQITRNTRETRYIRDRLDTQIRLRRHHVNIIVIIY
jgi:hypothetical protein